MIVMTPKDELECSRMLSTALECDGPVAVRYPRGSGPGVSLDDNALTPIKVGTAEKCREVIIGENINCNKNQLKIAILAFLLNFLL